MILKGWKAVSGRGSGSYVRLSRPPHQPSKAAKLHTCGSNRINGQQLQKCAEWPKYHSPLWTGIWMSNEIRSWKLSWPLETNNTPGGTHWTAVWQNIPFGSSRNHHHVCLTFSQISERRSKKFGSQQKTNIWDVSSDPTREWKNFATLESFWMLRSGSNFTVGVEIGGFGN